MMAWKLIVTFLILEWAYRAWRRYRLARKLGDLNLDAPDMAAELDRAFKPLREELERNRDSMLMSEAAAGLPVMRSPSGKLYSASCSCPQCAAARAEGPGEAVKP